MLKFWFCFHSRTLLCNDLLRRRLRVVQLRSSVVSARRNSFPLFAARTLLVFSRVKEINTMQYSPRRLMHLLLSFGGKLWFWQRPVFPIHLSKTRVSNALGSPRGSLMPSPRAAIKFAKAPPPGWQREQMPRGCPGRGGWGWAPLELTDA